VQGSEAGGHRGTFIGEDHLIGLMSLIPQVADVVNIPVIASGGIMDKRGFKAALCLGAETIQLGSALLMTTENNAHEQHKEVILNSKETDTVITKAFSGKAARVVKNKFIHLYEKNQGVLPYPHQNSLTKNMRKLAAENNDQAIMSLWSGQSQRLSNIHSVKKLINKIKKYENIMTKTNKQAEIDLYMPVQAYFEKLGYTVQAEVNDCDVVAYKDDSLIIIELKLNLNITLLMQAAKRQKITND